MAGLVTVSATASEGAAASSDEGTVEHKAPDGAEGGAVADAFVDSDSEDLDDERRAQRARRRAGLLKSSANVQKFIRVIRCAHMSWC